MDRLRRNARERMLNHFLSKCPPEYRARLREAALTNHVVMFVLPDMEGWMSKFLDELIGHHVEFKCMDQREFLSGRKVAPVAIPKPAITGEELRGIGVKIDMIQQ